MSCGRQANGCAWRDSRWICCCSWRGEHGELISRDEIAKHLWNDRVFVDVDAGIQTSVLKIRQALGDTGRRPALVETVSGKGYRFAAQVDLLQRDAHESSPGSVVEDLRRTRRHNLPAELTTFVGRSRELEELRQLLETSRLLTLTGSGGVGKTRLALRLAQGVATEFTHGVWMVDLGTLSGPEFIPDTIATAMGLREHAHQSVRETLREYLRDRDILLLLDTCEHVVAASAELVDSLLREAAGLRVITTTREALAIPGEVIYRVPSLSLPEGNGDLSAAVNAEAVRLFLDRARVIDTSLRPAAPVVDVDRSHLPPPRRHSARHRVGGRAARCADA